MPLRKGTRVNQCGPYRERAKHNAGRLLRISDNDSDGLIYGLPDQRLQEQVSRFTAVIERAPADSASFDFLAFCRKVAAPSYEDPKLTIDSRVDHWCDFSFTGFVLVRNEDDK